jgi:two-component system LytT family response regulator
MNCIIVDDEESARIELRTMLKDYPAISIVGEAASCCEALALLRQTDDVELLLLDIELPDGTGFDLVEQLDDVPRVIFITNYEFYALRAFEINAVDYIQKPVTRARLTNALERLNTEPAPPSDSIPLRSDDIILLTCDRRKYFVRIKEVLAIESEQNYTHVIRSTGRPLMVKKTLTTWAKQLPPASFKKIGRSRIVNIARVAQLQHRNSQYTLMFRNATFSMPLKRAEAKRIQQFIRKLK